MSMKKIHEVLGVEIAHLRSIQEDIREIEEEGVGNVGWSDILDWLEKTADDIYDVAELARAKCREKEEQGFTP